MKINPKQFHQDLAGYYLFPERFNPVEMWTGFKYKFIVELKTSANVLDLSTLTGETALALVRKVIGEEPRDPDLFLKRSTSKFSSPAYLAWQEMRQHFARKPGAWNKALRRAGYDAVFDDVYAIHSAEVQLVVLNPKAINVIERVDKKKGSGFSDMKQAAKELAKALKPFGEVELSPPRKVRVGWRSEKGLKATVRVAAGEDYARFTLTIENGKVRVSLSSSRLRLEYGSGADFDIHKKKWDRLDSLLDDVKKKSVHQEAGCPDSPMKSSCEILALYQQTFNAWNVFLMVTVIVGLKVFGEVFPEAFVKQPKGSPLWTQMPYRLLPVYPILACTFAYVCVPGPWIEADLTFGQKALLGLLCGYAAGHSQAVLKRLLPESLAALLDTKRRSSDRQSAPHEVVTIVEDAVERIDDAFSALPN